MAKVKTGSKELSFKQSIDRISEIVTIMEDGQCELEDMVDLYEEGSKLINKCETKLKNVKTQIEQININDKNIKE